MRNQTEIQKVKDLIKSLSSTEHLHNYKKVRLEAYLKSLENRR